jgi:hypothetical protein
MRHVARTGKKRTAYSILITIPEREKPHGELGIDGVEGEGEFVPVLF